MADKEPVMKFPKWGYWGEMIVWVLGLSIFLSLLTGCALKIDSVEPAEVSYITVEVYWSSQCSYCIAELVILEEISQEMIGHPYLDGKVQITAANLDLTSQELQEFLQTNPYSFRMTTGEKLPQWSNGYPTIVIRDAYGKIAFRRIGLVDKAQLYSMIMETLGFTEVI